MILPVSKFHNGLTFNGKEKDKKLPYDKDTLLKNNFATRSRIAFDRFTNALTLYTAKGLKGDKNANFYEFLTLGSIPYIVGSITLMAVCNLANKHFENFATSRASNLGRKMALGVLFYAILKEVSKKFVTTPVKWFTGVDTEVPYAKVIYELPDNVDDTDITSIEYHKAFESKEFPRWDLFYKSEAKGEVRNEYYDKIAKKLGLGENLKDSDQETKPVIKKIAIKTDTAKMLSSYLWAANGVALAFQEPWQEYLNVATLNFFKPEKFKHSLKVLGRSAKDSVKEFICGGKSDKFFNKHAGKLLLGAAVLSTILGVMNAVSIKKPSTKTAENVIDKKRESVKA